MAKNGSEPPQDAATPEAQANPQVSGFGMVIGIVGVLAIWQILSARRNEK